MLNCAKVCETSGCLQLSGSPFSHHRCKVCAEICDALVVKAWASWMSVLSRAGPVQKAVEIMAA